MIRLPYRQGTPEWLEARRSLVTATDLPAILGVSPWTCEADLADRKRGLAPEAAPSVAMRRGTALEPLVLALYAEATGLSVRRQRGMVRHAILPWAAASLDAVAPGRVVEAKTTGSRARFADGLPDDVAAQVQWQMGVSGLPACDVALLEGDSFLVLPVAFDPALFADFAKAAADFRRRLAAGGPFRTHSPRPQVTAARLRHDHPSDDGTVLPAGPDVERLVRTLAARKAAAKSEAEAIGGIENALRAMVGDAAGLAGDWGQVTWRRSADSSRVNWPAIAVAFRARLESTGADPAALAAVVADNTETVPGPRVLRTRLAEE